MSLKVSFVTLNIKTKYHYVRQLIYDGWTKIVKITTKDQIADPTVVRTH